MINPEKNNKLKVSEILSDRLRGVTMCHSIQTHLYTMYACKGKHCTLTANSCYNINYSEHKRDLIITNITNGDLGTIL